MLWIEHITLSILFIRILIYFFITIRFIGVTFCVFQVLVHILQYYCVDLQFHVLVNSLTLYHFSPEVVWCDFPKILWNFAIARIDSCSATLWWNSFEMKINETSNRIKIFHLLIYSWLRSFWINSVKLNIDFGRRHNFCWALIGKK